MSHRRPFVASGLLAAWLLPVLFVGVPAGAQDAPEPASPEDPPVAGAGGEDPAATLDLPVHPVRRATSPITIDGVLDEAVWSEALAVPIAYEIRPAENEPAPVETTVYLTFDDGYLYAGFRALDPDVGAIRARLTDRDTAFQDDWVGLFLVPSDDGRRGYELFVNPLGVQMDLFYDDVGGSEDESWDAIWSSAGRITADGYVVEMAIPFHQLRFPRRDGVQTWGFGAMRNYPRTLRHQLMTHRIDRDVACFLCQLHKVEGLEGISPGRNLEIQPTVTASRSDRRQDLPRDEIVEGDVDTEPGVTMRWGITPSLNLLGTVNPDFSQVEADVAQVDVNTQFALFFPERRPFFLDGADVFDTPLGVVFTRNVADPTWGGKITGKEGKHAIGAFVAEDELTNLILPGSQGSRVASLPIESLDGVFRYRRDLGERSALGGLVTSRDGDGYSNLVAGMDGLYRITDAGSISFQALRSETEYPGELALRHGQPLGAFSDEAFSVMYQHRERNWNGRAGYSDVGEGFRADMGFIPQVDYRRAEAGVNRVWWGDKDDRWTRMSFGGDWEITDDQSGQLLEDERELFYEVGGPWQSFLFLGVGDRERFFDGVTFDETYVNMFVEARPTSWLWAGLFARTGDQIDFANTRLGEQLVLELDSTLNLGRSVRADLSHDLVQLDVPGGRLFTANLSQLRLRYQLNLRTFVRGIFQYRDVERDPALYDDPVTARSERLFSQLLFSYKLNPQTVLFVGYSDDRLGGVESGLTQEGRALFLKVGYAWIP